MYAVICAVHGTQVQCPPTGHCVVPLWFHTQLKPTSQVKGPITASKDDIIYNRMNSMFNGVYGTFQSQRILKLERVLLVQGCRLRTRPPSSGCGTDEHFRSPKTGRYWRMAPVSSCTLAQWTGSPKCGSMGNTWACTAEGVHTSPPVLLILKARAQHQQVCFSYLRLEAQYQQKCFSYLRLEPSINKCADHT